MLGDFTDPAEDVDDDDPVDTNDPELLKQLAELGWRDEDHTHAVTHTHAHAPSAHAAVTAAPDEAEMPSVQQLKKQARALHLQGKHTYATRGHLYDWYPFRPQPYCGRMPRDARCHLYYCNTFRPITPFVQ